MRRIAEIIAERKRTLLLTPLPSSQLPSASARRSLSAGPDARSAPSSLALLGSEGATPPRTTRAGVKSGGVVVCAGKPLTAKLEETSAARVSADAYSTETRREAVFDSLGSEAAGVTVTVNASSIGRGYQYESSL